MIRTYEFRLRPTKLQEDALWLQLRLTRELYNQGLQELVEHYGKTKKHINLFAHGKLHGLKQHPLIHSHIVDTTLKRLHRSFENFFRRCKQGAKEKGFPRFKSSNRWHSLQFRDSVSNYVSDNYFIAPKKCGGRIRFNRHRDIEGIQKHSIILHRMSGWYLQVVCEVDDKSKLLPKTGKFIGLDFGLKSLVTDSDGNKVENPRYLKWSLKKLAILQQRAAKKKKGSNRRKKAVRLIVRHYERISNRRKDYLHKTARKIVNENDIICLEDLRIDGMVHGYASVSRAVYDASWSMLRQMIEVKAESAGREVIAVPPQYTSQKCSSCGELVQKSLSERTHCCPHCGYTDCRDTNAAKNILRLGLGLRGDGHGTVVETRNTKATL